MTQDWPRVSGISSKTQIPGRANREQVSQEIIKKGSDGFKVTKQLRHMTIDLEDEKLTNLLPSYNYFPQRACRKHVKGLGP